MGVLNALQNGIGTIEGEGMRNAGPVLVRIALVAGLALCLSPIVTEPVLAQVPRIQGQGTAASGMGNAFSAQADDPSALHYNAAGMTQLHGVEFMTGVLLSGGTTTFTSPTGATATGDRNGSVVVPPESSTPVMNSTPCSCVMPA